jgi:hypothetical protein
MSDCKQRIKEAIKADGCGCHPYAVEWKQIAMEQQAEIDVISQMNANLKAEIDKLKKVIEWYRHPPNFPEGDR